MDHLIYTLVSKMLPNYIACCRSQDLGFKGLNLADKQREQIHLQVVEMNDKCILNLGNRLHMKVPG